MVTENAAIFFEKVTGSAPTSLVCLAQSGSSRVNFIAENGDGQFIITANENMAENESFIYFSELFESLQLNTPKILHISEDRRMYLQQHVGTQTLSEIISQEGLTGRTSKLVKETLQKLFVLQQKTQQQIDYTRTFEYESYSRLAVMHDLFYFKSFIADILELPYRKGALLEEFSRIAGQVAELQPRGIMLRDFQARNILVNDADEVFFIDYQAATEGPLLYDVISFLFQAKANFPADFKTEMLNYYFSLHEAGQAEELKRCVGHLTMIRYLQVLGAYGFRGLVQKKAHFQQSLEAGIKNIAQLTQDFAEMQHYPELCGLIRTLEKEETKDKIKGFILK